jgi:hypothetical protein
MFKTFSMTDLAIIAVLLDEEENNLKNINPKRLMWLHDILQKRKVDVEHVTLIFVFQASLIFYNYIS